MDMVWTSLFIFVASIIIALLLYVYMPKQCSKPVKESLENEVPYYKSTTPLRPNSTDDYKYYNGIYCKKGDDDCKEYAYTCTVGEDPNCRNYDSATADCYDKNGKYICDTTYDASDYTEWLHDVAGSCQTISGEYICSGSAWGKSDEKWLSFVELDDVEYTNNPSCEVVKGEIVCDEEEIEDQILEEEVDATNNCQIVDGNIVCDYNRSVLYDSPGYDVDTVFKGYDSPPYGLNEWGVSSITNSILRELENVNATRSSYHTLDNLHENDSCKLVNGDIMCDYATLQNLYAAAHPTTTAYSDWNRNLESPTTNETIHSDMLTKIYNAIYLLASRNDCSQGIYGCCPDKQTAKTDPNGSNCASLNEEVKKYIDMEITKTAEKLTPPASSTLANIQTLPSTQGTAAQGTTTQGTTTQGTTQGTTSQGSTTNGTMESAWAAMSGSTPPLNPTAFQETDTSPAQRSYTSTVFLAGPKGGMIGNCPEPSFECKKGNCKQNNLPMPLLADFSSFGK